MRTRIFAYRGIVGAETDLDNGHFLNNPKKSGQLGCTMLASEVDITPEAKEILRNAPRESGSFSSIMLTRRDDGVSFISLLGYWKHVFMGNELMIGRDCDTTVLDDCNEDSSMVIPEDFISFVNKKLC